MALVTASSPSSTNCLSQSDKLWQMLATAQQCSERGLYNSAKWSAELATSIQADLQESSKNNNNNNNSNNDDDEGFLTPSPEFVKAAGDANKFAIEEMQFVLAKSYFDLREYDRAAHVLRKCKSHKAFFLRHYASYLVGEKRKEEETSDLLAPLDQSSASNEHLPEIRAALLQRQSESNLDGYGHYLLGLVYMAQGLKEEAVDAYIKSTTTNPLFWGSWMELGNYCSDVTDIDKLMSKGIPSEHWMAQFFHAYLALELHQSDEALAMYLSLADEFPKSSYLRAQVAVSYYTRREFDESEEVFEQLRKTDPFRLENVDTYSNILYVKESKTELSYLAHEACRIEQYRAETCCVIGNYYSLKNRHEKAVIYFQRALKLNRKYLSAWTLMGHEYVELKNSPAAIEAYRRAVEINTRDYRAWYGLGQTYELLKMPLYSLYYYRQAQRLRPYDARMWSALAHTYRELQRWPDTIKCYERTIALNDGDSASLFELAAIYREHLKDNDQAAQYYQRVIEVHEMEASVVESEHTVGACQFLSEYYQDKQMLQEAEKYAMRLMNVGGHKHKESAKTMLSQIHSSRDTAALPSPDRSQLASSPAGWF